MRKAQIDQMLEAAVAKALGVDVPRLSRRMVRARKPAAHHAVKRAA